MRLEKREERREKREERREKREERREKREERREGWEVTAEARLYVIQVGTLPTHCVRVFLET